MFVHSDTLCSDSVIKNSAMKIDKAFIGWKIHIFTPRVQDESSIFLLSFLRKWQNLKYVSYKTTFSPSLGLILVYSCWDGAGLMWWRHFKMVLYCLIVYRFPVTTNNVLISVTTESFVSTAWSLCSIRHRTNINMTHCFTEWHVALLSWTQPLMFTLLCWLGNY